MVIERLCRKQFGTLELALVSNLTGTPMHSSHLPS